MRRSALQLIASPGYHTLGETWFMELIHDRRLRYVIGARWVTGADGGDDALAAAASARVSYADDNNEEFVVEFDYAVAHVILTGGTATVRAAGATRAATEAARERVAAMAPASHSNGVDVSARFWWWDSDYATHIARPVRVPRWEEIGRNYSAATARRLEQLVGWRGGPPTGGRLIICHGPSGTGKTHAVQMLAGAWRDWADLHVISDPEQFLSNPAYLMSVASAHGEGDGGRWRVAVLEDAGEQLAFDGRGSQQAVGRLLNVGDGVLGQALRMLVLITTNEPLDRLDARVRRPGRQLAEVPFAPLNRDEIGRWCADRPLEPPDRGSVTLADLYALAAGAELSAPPRPVGFSPAGG